MLIIQKSILSLFGDINDRDYIGYIDYLHSMIAVIKNDSISIMNTTRRGDIRESPASGFFISADADISIFND